MKVNLQKAYWKDILLALNMLRLLASFYTEEDKPFCENLRDSMTISILAIERALKEDSMI